MLYKSSVINSVYCLNDFVCLFGRKQYMLKWVESATKCANVDTSYRSSILHIRPEKYFWKCHYKWFIISETAKVEETFSFFHLYECNSAEYVYFVKSFSFFNLVSSFF